MGKRDATRLIILLFLLTTGCATTYDVSCLNRESLLYVTIGMSREQVAGIMGTATKTVYNSKRLTVCGIDRELGDTYVVSRNTFTSYTNPFEHKTIYLNGKEYEIDYYVTGWIQKHADVTDKELTPLIFQNGILIGWGWEYLCELYREEHGTTAALYERS